MLEKNGQTWTIKQVTRAAMNSINVEVIKGDWPARLSRMQRPMPLQHITDKEPMLAQM